MVVLIDGSVEGLKAGIPKFGSWMIIEYINDSFNEKAIVSLRTSVPMSWS